MDIQTFVKRTREDAAWMKHFGLAFIIGATGICLMEGGHRAGFVFILIALQWGAECAMLIAVLDFFNRPQDVWFSVRARILLFFVGALSLFFLASHLIHISRIGSER